jgi:short-subunit dehydrogenase
MDSKTVVIIGASSGIGAALARTLAQQRHQLVLAARRETELRAVAGECGARAVAVVADARHRSDVDAVRDQALTQFGAVDVWVNNVGRGISRKVMDLTEDELDEMFAVNLKSALFGMQAIVPHFRERGKGHLINVSSFLGRVPLVTFRSAYNAAKAGLNALTANLRVDLAREFPNIHVSLVMPGIVGTDFARSALGGTQTLLGGAGAGPSQSAEEVAEVIARLIAKPCAEVYTNPASAGIARRYFEDVAAFEAGMAHPA